MFFYNFLIESGRNRQRKYVIQSICDHANKSVAVDLDLGHLASLNLRPKKKGREREIEGQKNDKLGLKFEGSSDD